MGEIRKMYDNIVNKSPKLILILALMAALVLNKGMIFGNDITSTPSDRAVVTPRFVEEFYGAPMSFTTLDSVVYEIRRTETQIEPSGYMVSTVDYSSRYRGFGGRTPVVIFADSAMVICGVRMLANNESENFVGNIERAGFFEQWNGLHLYDPMPEADAYSGATYTARSVIANVEQTLSALLDRLPVQLTLLGVIERYYGELAILVVVIVAFIFYMFPAATRRFRVLMLLLTIGVLGVWQGAFLSLDLLYKWLIYGTSPAARFGIFAVVLTAFVIPLLTNKSFYCNYLCPFGATQELVGKLGCALRRSQPAGLSPRILALSKWVRFAILLLLIVVILCGRNVELADVEPFTLFMIRFASVSALLIAGVSLVGSLFVHRPWCRLLCPTGEILSLLKRTVKYKK